MDIVTHTARTPGAIGDIAALDGRHDAASHGVGAPCTALRYGLALTPRC